MTETEPRVKAVNRGAKGGRAKIVASRVSCDEYQLLNEKARDAGLKVGSYLRACGLGSAGPRSRRSPPLNAELLSYVAGQLNRAGNNLNQLNKRLHAARAVEASETAIVVAELRAAIRQICECLGRRERDDRQGQHSS